MRATAAFFGSLQAMLHLRLQAILRADDCDGAKDCGCVAEEDDLVRVRRLDRAGVLRAFLQKLSRFTIGVVEVCYAAAIAGKGCYGIGISAVGGVPGEDVMGSMETVFGVTFLSMAKVYSYMLIMWNGPIASGISFV